MSDENEVLYDVKDRIATVTLNRPDRMNSVNDALPGNIAKAMVKAATDPGVRAIILTGAGRAFCAGADIARLQQSSTTPARARRRQLTIRPCCPPLLPDSVRTSDRNSPTSGAIHTSCGSANR